ncbi:type II secretion system protein [Gudongella sp.]
MIQWFNKKMNKKRKGFTLIELVVVIAILGLLAALAIPRFGNVRDDAEKATLVADARSVYTSVMMYYAENGSYPTAETDLGPNYLDVNSLGITGWTWSQTSPDLVEVNNANWKVMITENGVDQTTVAEYTAP